MSQETSRREVLARVRKNQQRSRKAKKDHLKEVEDKLREFERQAAQERVRFQQAAQLIDNENKRLRILIHSKGYNIERLSQETSYLPIVDGPSAAELVRQVQRFNKQVARWSSISGDTPTMTEEGVSKASGSSYSGNSTTNNSQGGLSRTSSFADSNEGIPTSQSPEQTAGMSASFGSLAHQQQLQQQRLEYQMNLYNNSQGSASTVRQYSNTELYESMHNTAPHDIPGPYATPQVAGQHMYQQPQPVQSTSLASNMSQGYIDSPVVSHPPTPHSSYAQSPHLPSMEQSQNKNIPNYTPQPQIVDFSQDYTQNYTQNYVPGYYQVNSMQPAHNMYQDQNIQQSQTMASYQSGNIYDHLNGNQLTNSYPSPNAAPQPNPYITATANYFKQNISPPTPNRTIGRSTNDCSTALQMLAGLGAPGLDMDDLRRDLGCPPDSSSCVVSSHKMFEAMDNRLET